MRIRSNWVLSKEIEGDRSNNVECGRMRIDSNTDMLKGFVVVTAEC